eukprot:CAMPEP_0114611772 /NCGR_PEP_ID=MMETSP0168-20121206/4287_1 /TAXON_ID=95228 ORGANISM="Vannella sp., Strain DIVA3 517/6/12" /NCGR_SAMPLE_ID=MMETSP0168 /ASSEMBLY_ACC=CAM_ASM_000044 /LENGTH=479 /DNA_ID=CAMNT_0001822753 /DNA_START=77 /DNA_END=1516 /DNA_ORIENTATION=+
MRKSAAVQFFSTSYCFYVLALLVVVEYYIVIGSIGNAPSLAEVETLIRFSPPLDALRELEPESVLLADRRLPIVGDPEQGCRVRWSHPRQNWDTFNLPCPDAIAEQVAKKNTGLVQVASVVPQGRVNNRAQCVLVEDRWFCMPTFLVIGAPHSGSLTVNRWMERHPTVVPPREVGTDYLNIPKGDVENVWDYFEATCPSNLALRNPPEEAQPQGFGAAGAFMGGSDHGPDPADSPWTHGEAACYDHSVSLLAGTKAPITVRRAPWARTCKKVVLVRDPTRRLVSQFFAEHPDWEWRDLEYAVKVAAGDFRECACNILNLGDVGYCEEATANTGSHGLLWPLSVPSLMERVYPQCKKHLEETFLDQGFYYLHLKSWLDIGFDPSQFQLVSFKELKNKPLDTMSAMFQHVAIGLKASEIQKIEESLMADYGQTSFPDSAPKEGMKSKEAAAVSTMLGALYSQHNRRFMEFVKQNWDKDINW